MVAPDDVPRIVLDAARLVGEGEVVVFGSAALAYWLREAPRSRDVDLFVTPTRHGDVLVALMGELSWYHQRHGAYVEVLAPETFAAPVHWRSRARSLDAPHLPRVAIVVPRPHDILLSKVERFDPADQDHARRILAEFPLETPSLDALTAETPYRLGLVTEARRVAAFETNLARLRLLLPPA